MKKTASAVWKGDLKSGQGTISSQSGALKNQPYGFNTRFADQPGTNPEELLGAAHAGCFSMALSNILGEAGLKADSIETTAEVTLDKTDDGFTITAVHLTVNAVVPGATKDSFADAGPPRPRPVAPCRKCSMPGSAWTPRSRDDDIAPRRPQAGRQRAWLAQAGATGADAPKSPDAGAGPRPWHAGLRRLRREPRRRRT